MNPKEHKKDFNRRFNISSTLDSPEEAFKKFKQRILNIFQTVKLEDDFSYLEGIDKILTEESVFNFCQYCSISPNISIINYLINENNEIRFYQLIEIILSLVIKGAIFDNEKVEKYLIKKIKEAIEMSDVNVAMTKNPQGDIILYPKGEKELDDTLVNQTLTFLNPESNKHFEEALKLYQKNNSVKSTESLRRCLEEFLRYKLENKKGLEQNIKTLQKNIKAKSDPKIRNIIFQTFKHLDQYFNENSKHKDGDIDEPENEFLIYQTGLLMRYIKTHH